MLYGPKRNNIVESNSWHPLRWYSSTKRWWKCHPIELLFVRLGCSIAYKFNSCVKRIWISSNADVILDYHTKSTRKAMCPSRGQWFVFMPQIGCKPGKVCESPNRHHVGLRQPRTTLSLIFLIALHLHLPCLTTIVISSRCPCIVGCRQPAPAGLPA